MEDWILGGFESEAEQMDFMQEQMRFLHETEEETLELENVNIF